MKRFLAFSNSRYYPDGGMDDFRGDFDTLEEAMFKVAGLADDWGHIWDSEQRVIVERFWEGKLIAKP